jgi:membrane dipeptidase
MKYYFIFLPLFFAWFNGHTQGYIKLHSKAIVVDTHNDILSNGTMKGLNIENDLTDKTHSDLRRFKKGGVDVQVFSVWCDSTFGKDAAFEYANIEIDSLYATANRNPDKLLIATTPADIKKAVSQKKTGCYDGCGGRSYNRR